MTLDHTLVAADLIARVTVLASSRRGDLVTTDVHVHETWATRWDVRQGQRLAVTTSAGFPGNKHFAEGQELVVLLSGGPWSESPFTHRQNSIFVVADDATLRCTSGNPLFAVTDAGFHCSIPALTAGTPVTVDELKATIVELRSRSGRRLSALAGDLDLARRPLRHEPTETDTSDLEPGVVR